MTDQRTRLDALTILRGLAAAWVVTFHFQDVLFATLDLPASGRTLVLHGHLAVDLFFILSGFVLAYNYLYTIRLERRSCTRFWLLRLARIYPAHLAGLLVVAAMVGASRVLGLRISDEGYGLLTFAQHLTLTQAWVPDMKLSWNYPAWSVSSEWLAYLLFPVIAACVRRLRTRFAPHLLLSLIVACLVAGSYATPETPFWELVRVLVAFPVGVALCRIAEDWSVKPVAGRVVLISALSLLVILASERPSYVALMAAFCVLIVGLAGLEDRHSGSAVARPFLWLGEVSYSLYISHTLVQKVLNETLPASAITSLGAAGKLACLLVYAALVLGVAHAFWRLIESPSRQAVKRAVSRAHGDHVRPGPSNPAAGAMT